MILAYAALFGLAFGSFLNATIDRIPRGQSLNGRSHCDGCGKTLTAAELIPILSYLVLRGQCASCHARISPRVPLVEASSAAAFVAAFAALPAPQAIAACAAYTIAVALMGILVEKRGVRW